jgi:acyl-CoA synthetase (AMP-forming)/AMP-acid ligase II
VTALPPALLASFVQDGLLRDPACKLNKLGCVWPSSQLATGLPEPPDTSVLLFDFYPLGDLAGLPRPRVPGSDPTLMPLGEVVSDGKNGDSTSFLEIGLGEDRGEVRLRGAVVPRGSAAGPLTPDGKGFVATGLLARREGDGTLRLCRDPETLHPGGIMVAASELDALYRSVPGALDAACFTLSDPVLGDRIFAAIVLKPGQTISLEGLHAFLRLQGVAPYKFPDGVTVVTAIPRDADGRVLREQFQAMG